MRNIEEQPYGDLIVDWFKRIGYVPVFYESHTPVRVPGPVKRLTKRERERVDSLSKERGYRPFHAYGRFI